MSFSWNKWRQYIIEEASVNEEIHEGVWGYGSPQKMKKYIDKLKDIFVMNDEQEINKEITRIDSALFNIFGSDDFHDTYDRAKTNLKKGDLDRFKNDLSDLIVKAREIHADQLKGFTDINEEDPQAVFNRGPNDFGNDDESRFQFIAYRLSAYENHPQYKELQGHVRTMADEMDIEERSLKFDDAFAKALKIMDLEHMAMDEGSLVNPEAEEIDPEDLDAAADYFDSLEEAKPGFAPDKILKSFIEDFEKASMSTGDIPYAQGEVIDAYKKTFPHMDEFIDLWLEQNHNKELKKFQNVADNPEVRGMDMMAELEGEVQTERRDDRQNVDRGQDRGFSIYDLEDEDEEIDAFDEALNDMALERAEVAKKLDAMQNDLEATLSQDEIDTLSDAIVLLRQK